VLIFLSVMPVNILEIDKITIFKFRDFFFAIYFRTSKSDRSERLEAAYDAMLDDDFDDEMMISDMPTMNNKTNSKNKHDATTVTSNSGDTRFQNISNMTEKTCAPNNGDHAIEREETDKRKRTLFNVNRDVDDFGRRSPQPSTSRVTGWLNKSTHMVVPDKNSQESQSPVVPNQSKVYDKSQRLGLWCLTPLSIIFQL